MKKSFYIFYIIIFITSCNTPIDNNNLMQIDGVISDLRKGSLFLKKYQDSVLVTIDSFEIKGNGVFNLKAELNGPEIFHLYLKKDDGDSLNDRIVFFGSKGNIKIKTRLKTFESSAYIEGSENNDLLEEYKSISRKFNSKNLELLKLYLEAQKSQNIKLIDSFQKQINRLNKRRYLYTLNFANTHSDKMISPFIIITEMDNANPSYLDTIAKKMPENIRNSKYGKSFFRILKRNKKEVKLD
ncbi:MAG: hypothetical protein ACI914_000740 [Candidatus Marivariicella framensis]|jgi:hypothetical protein|tara:strand:+ start:929 stop:1651 length:723 start_codon:yes stop_codon:yes gene_type:complete